MQWFFFACFLNLSSLSVSDVCWLNALNIADFLLSFVQLVLMEFHHFFALLLRLAFFFFTVRVIDAGSDIILMFLPL